MNKNREAVAFHEAGHAVVALRHHVRLREITIRPEDDALGRVAVRYPRWFITGLNDGLHTPRVFKYAVDVAIVLFAGPASERLFTGRASHVGAVNDYRAVGKLTANLCGSERQRRAMLRWLRVSAEDVVGVDHIREQIATMANALMLRETLRGTEIEAVLSG